MSGVKPGSARLGRGLGALMMRTDEKSAESPEGADDVSRETSPTAVSRETSTRTSPGKSGKRPGTESTPEPDGDVLGSLGDATLVEIPLDRIRANEDQPRQVFDDEALDELAESLREVGVLQPIVVRPDGDGYEIVMGERRFRAAGRAGLPTITAIVRPTADVDMLRDALLENLHRVQLNPLEEAAAYQQMLDDFGCSQEELSLRVHRSRPQITNTLRLLKLPATVQRRVAAGTLTAGHARALLRLEDGLAQERLAQRIVAEGLSVRTTEELATLNDSQDVSRETRPRGSRQPSEKAVRIGSVLSDHFDTRVKVNIGRTKGKISIEFASTEDLDRILQIMKVESDQL